MTSRLRVQFLAAYTIPAGTYFRVHNLARALIHRGHDVVVRAVDPDARSASRTELRDDVPYDVIRDSRGAHRFGAASHPVTALRRVRASAGTCDVVHLFQPFLGPSVPWYAARRAALRVFDWDDLWWGGALPARTKGFGDAWMTWWVRVLERRLPRDANLVTTCSGFLAARARAAGAHAVHVVHNGCWPAPVPDRTAARRRLKLDPGACYAGFMGRTADELRWCTAALGAAAAIRPEVRLAVCGPPPSLLDGLAPDLRSRIDYLGVITPEETRWFAAAMDLGLLPLADTPFNQSRFPIKFAEYLGAGLPVLMSDVGECAAIAASWPWVLRAGHSELEFRAAFVDVTERLTSLRPPRVDPKMVEDALSWNHLGARLEASYLTALARS